MPEQDKRKPSSLRWHNRRKTLITLRWKRGIPRLVIHEKYEKLVKWSLRAVTVMAIVSSIGFMPIWYFELVLAIVIVAVEQFIERSVFLYTIFYWQPLPDFKWDIGQEWVSMGFASPVPRGERELNVVGPVFKIESYAHEFFELLRRWNYDYQEDRENNICLSFVTVNDGYFVFIYPNLARHTIKETFSEIEEMKKIEKYGKEPQPFVVQFIFCKHFTYASNSMFNKFWQEQPEGQPYWLQPFIQNSDGTCRILFSEKPILKFQVKIGPRSQLEQRGLEYQHFKNVIDGKPEY
ncbi:MAG: hypothetical protein WBC50_00605 [Dehalococcoidales bacterium]